MSTPPPVTPQAPPPQVVIQPSTAPPARGRGCWLWGCLGCGGLLVLLVGGCAIASWTTTKKFTEEWTQDVPAELPTHDLSLVDPDDVKARVAAFQEAKTAGSEATLELTADDLNALVESNPETRGRLSFDITEDDELGAAVSWPLDEIPFPFFKGRYANARVSLKVRMDGPGDPYIGVRDLELAGRTPPAEVMSELRGENFAANLESNPEFSKMMKNVRDIRVEDGRLVLETTGSD